MAIYHIAEYTEDARVMGTWSREARCFFEAFQAIVGLNANSTFAYQDSRNSPNARAYLWTYRERQRIFVVTLDALWYDVG
jgi:hypothetical protein